MVKIVYAPGVPQDRLDRAHVREAVHATRVRLRAHAQLVLVRLRHAAQPLARSPAWTRGRTTGSRRTRSASSASSSSRPDDGSSSGRVAMEVSTATARAAACCTPSRDARCRSLRPSSRSSRWPTQRATSSARRASGCATPIFSTPPTVSNFDAFKEAAGYSEGRRGTRLSTSAFTRRCDSLSRGFYPRAARRARGLGRRRSSTCRTMTMATSRGSCATRCGCPFSSSGSAASTSWGTLFITKHSARSLKHFCRRRTSPSRSLVTIALVSHSYWGLLSPRARTVEVRSPETIVYFNLRNRHEPRRAAARRSKLRHAAPSLGDVAARRQLTRRSASSTATR